MGVVLKEELVERCLFTLDPSARLGKQTCATSTGWWGRTLTKAWPARCSLPTKDFSNHIYVNEFLAFHLQWLRSNQIKRALKKGFDGPVVVRNYEKWSGYQQIVESYPVELATSSLGQLREGQETRNNFCKLRPSHTRLRQELETPLAL